jgi:hypothetical protein
LQVREERSNEKGETDEEDQSVDGLAVGKEVVS